MGVLGAQGAGCGHALDVPAKWTLAGADPLSHGAARYHRILLCAVSIHINTGHSVKNYYEINERVLFSIFMKYQPVDSLIYKSSSESDLA